MTDLQRLPVVVAIGEFVDREVSPEHATEPVGLMAEALRACDSDGNGHVLNAINQISVVGLVSWRYHDPVSLLCEALDIDPEEKVNASMGGETPIRLLHEAAVRIASGEDLVAAVVGGEASSARNRARRAGIKLRWTPAAPREEAVRFPSSRYAMSPIAKELGMTDPAQIYPLYENATQASLGQTPLAAHHASASLWEIYAKTAAGNPSAWLQTTPSAQTIGNVTADNRMINWPYPKLMVANPSVNQSAAFIVSSYAKALDLGVAEEQLIHIWGGAAASEPEDYLLRDRYDHSSAQKAVLDRVVELVGGDSARFDHLELYSCFPIVPKMALRTLGLDPAERSPTVTGGLTFFGGPLNNYMSHAVAAMTRTLRANPGEIGLLYGQGGYVNKHHALILSTGMPPTPLATEYSVQDAADAGRTAVPSLAEAYEGTATVETYTVTYARDGAPLQGIVIARTADNKRTMARVPAGDDTTMALLTSWDKSAVGLEGRVRTDAFGKPVFSASLELPIRPRKTTQVDREGHLTIVTIDRPEAMNALDPDTNAELAEIFDDFVADDDQWVAIITGSGDRAFSSGNDLKDTARRMARGEALETPVTGFAGLTGRFDLNKPVIAAVNGVAMGGGMEVALACDLIIASQTASFALPEPKVGLAALEGGLLRLPQHIGLKQAMGMILTGRTIGAEEARQLGFVNEVVSPEQLMAAARRWAGEMIALSPLSLRASKEIVHKGLAAPSIATAYTEQRRYPTVRALFRSADLREGPLAFSQKRKPQWKGR